MHKNLFVERIIATWQTEPRCLQGGEQAEGPGSERGQAGGDLIAPTNKIYYFFPKVSSNLWFSCLRKILVNSRVGR